MQQLEQIIPPERLELLDELTLYDGAHGGGTGGPDCPHCARELLHEVVTGEHADRTPPGVTAFAALLPCVSDGPWRDDAHRTAVLRPYLPRFLPPAFGGLDPANDEKRVYPLLDHAYRKMAPDVLDLLQLKDEAATLRGFEPIVDLKTAGAAIKEGDRALARALALDLVPDRTLAFALAIDLALDRARAFVLNVPFDFACDLIIALDFALDCALDCALDLTAEERGNHWEQSVRDLLDLVCSIP